MNTYMSQMIFDMIQQRGLNSVSVVCWGEGLAGKQGSESEM